MNVRKLGENVFLLKPYNKTDILSLFLLFSQNNVYVVKDVFWQPKIRREGVYERGERKKVRVKLTISKVYLEKQLNGLRLTGRAVESTNESVKGRGIGLTINIGDEIVVDADGELIERYVFETVFEDKVVVFNFDDVQATISLINSGIKLIDYKYYGSQKKEFSSILDRVLPLLNEALKLKNEFKLKLIVASSSVFLGYLKRKLREENIYFLETGSSGDFFGLLEIMRSEKFHKLLPRASSVYRSRISETVKKKLLFGEGVYGLNEVLDAFNKKICRALIATSPKIYELLKKDKERVEKLVLVVKKIRGDLLVIDVDTELGTLVNSLGGLICI